LISIVGEVGILLVSRKKIKEELVPSKGEEKRPFFPEDIIDSDVCFHFGLLSF
jgi:hypothetical protein